MSTITTASLYNNFINSIRSEITKSHYIYALNKYMKYYSCGIEKLLGEPRLIESNIIQYIVWLKQDEKLSSGTIRCYVAAIIHFYVMNDIVLNTKKIGMYLGERIKKQKDRGYTTEEIHRLLDFCDERQKALVLLLASTGIRIGAIPELDLKHLNKISEYGLYRLSIYEGTKEEYFTFTTPEAATAIDTYLDYRKRCGEKLIPDSPLFREQFDPNDLLAVRYPKKLSLKAFSKLLDDKLHKSGIVSVVKQTEGMKFGGRRNEVYRAHGFRKFVTTNMIRAKLNAECREMLLGHRIGLSNAYYKPGEEEVLVEYLKVVDLLTINEENRLKRKVEELTIEKSKLDSMQSQLNNVQSMLSNMTQGLQQATSQQQFEVMAQSLLKAGALKAASPGAVEG